VHAIRQPRGVAVARHRGRSDGEQGAAKAIAGGMNAVFRDDRQLSDGRRPHVREPRGRFKLTPQSCKLPVEAVEHRLPRRSHKSQCFPLTGLLSPPVPGEREIPSARHGRAALRLGMIPCALRQHSERNLHTVLDCPGGTFPGAGVKTVVLFFEKGSPTRKVWYYQLDPGRNLGKTNALNDDDLKEFVKLQASFVDSEKSWSVDVTGIDQTSFDLSVKNPNKAEEAALRDPQDIIAEIAALDVESAEILEGIRGLL
jgi:hypothetical protein